MTRPGICLPGILQQARGAMTMRLVLAGLVVLLSVAVTGTAHAQVGRKPTAREVAAIRECAEKYADDVFEGERQCVFNLIATPCTEKPENTANINIADCYRVEQAIWDDLLNENFKALRADLDDKQATKLRDMQRAWIAYRDTTCAFYMDKMNGTLAIPVGNACAARETARRALLLKFFAGL
jgi:uncharacterized protein YecT (DUF1311 family)